MKERAITCLRPSSGGLHLGHWIGNIQPLILNQYIYDCSFIFGDLQLGSSFNCDKIRDNIILMAKQMIALGVDPNSVHFMIESEIKKDKLGDLILLSEFITSSRINRLPVFKTQNRSNNMSMMMFPLLEMLDFYISGASIAFSNTDNQPIIEMTNEVFRRINNELGYHLPHIELIHGTVEKLVGFDGKKMSKSAGNCIFFSDDEISLHYKINKMYTDPNHVSGDIPGNISHNIVFMYFKAFLPESLYQSLVWDYEHGKLSDSESKHILFETLNTLIKECKVKTKDISDSEIERILGL